MAADAAVNKEADHGRERAAKPAKRKKRHILAPLLIILALIIAGVGIFGFNLFGWRDSHIYPALAKVPLIGRWIPQAATAPDDFSAMSRDQLVAQATTLSNQVKDLQSQLDAANTQNTSNQAEITRLQAFENQQTQFKADKADFDAQVALNDPQAYANYYASISPENAEKLYPQAAAAAQASTQLKNYVSNFTNMDESNAAEVLAQMVPTDMNLVVSILDHMDSQSAGDILNEMPAATAASVMKMMAPSGI
jgi:flagellar motility protein MotE (MotC chaperone)